MIARGFGALFGVLAQFVLARLLPLDQYGIYAFAMSWIGVLAIMSKLGSDTALLRFSSEYSSQQDWPRLRGVLRWATGTTLGVGALAGCLFALGTFIVFGADTPNLRTLTLYAAAAGVPFLALNQVQAAALRGFKQTGRGATLDVVLRPLLVIVLVTGVAGLAWLPMDAPHAMGLTVAALILTVLAGRLWIHRFGPVEMRSVAPAREGRSWLRISFPMLLMNGAAVVMANSSVIILGLFDSTASAGVYNVVARLTTLVSFGLLATNAIVAPMIAELYSHGRREDLQRIVRLGARLTFLFTLGATLFLFFFGHFALGLFGREYVVGFGAMMIVLVGQLANSLCGPTGYFMSMTGHQRQAAKILAVTAAANVALNIGLVPYYGIYGAAGATAFSMIAWNVVMLLYVRRKEGIRLSIV